jgi:hypothetical protein
MISAEQAISRHNADGGNAIWGLKLHKRVIDARGGAPYLCIRFKDKHGANVCTVRKPPEEGSEELHKRVVDAGMATP